MPAAAIVTLALTALTVLVLAAYLVWVALALRHVGRSLGELVGVLEIVGRQTAPIGEAVEGINEELAAVHGALADVVGDVGEDRPTLGHTHGVSR